MKQHVIEGLRRRFWSRVGDPYLEHVRSPLRRRLNAGREYRPVFVCGAMSAGTSLLALQLGQRFSCAAVIYESAHAVSPSSMLHSKGPEPFADVASYFDSILPAPSWSQEKARHDLLEAYRSWASGPSPIVIDKGPNTNLVRAGFLARCFPDASFVLIFRDPVVTIEGFRRKWSTFGNEPVAASIGFWRDIHERFLVETADFAGRVAAVDYVDLVERNDETLSILGDRLQLEPAAGRLRMRSRANIEGRGARNVRRGKIGVVPDADRQARERVEDADAREIRAALDPLSQRLRALCAVSHR